MHDKRLMNLPAWFDGKKKVGAIGSYKSHIRYQEIQSHTIQTFLKQLESGPAPSMNFMDIEKMILTIGQTSTGKKKISKKQKELKNALEKWRVDLNDLSGRPA